MHFSRTAVLALASMLSAPALACKCLNIHNKNVIEKTKSCCSQFGGDFSGDDCGANSISEKLKNFDYCCMIAGKGSDCGYNVGWRRSPEEEEEDGFRTVVVV